ncbi:MAG TPA: 6-phosphogluconolactonase [Verrucomicrobiota bacterium]|nr:6-phosphogluconolactonase [Verrucomicrobiota bacterium]HRZ56131.1 6-phosphogluconolactonase [Candidatus Paceibacterota bacterium]
MNTIEWLPFPDAASLADAAGRRWAAEVAAGATHGKAFSVALSGGRIAAPLYAAAVAASRGRVDLWGEVEFFFADERWVPLDDPESNYRLAREHLFDPLGIADRRIHPFSVSADTEFAVAQAQAEVLRATTVNERGDPMFDLVLLGMGEDGHVASLFPDAPPAVVESRAVYLAVTGPKPPPRRVTLSYAVLAAARRVWVLASGPGKRAALEASLAPGGKTPLARVLQSRKRTVILTDVAVTDRGRAG